MADPGHINGPNFIANCVAIRLHWLLVNGKVAYNVLHARYESTPVLDQTFINNLHTSISSALVATGLAGRLANQTVLQHTGIRDMRSEGSPPTGYSEWVSNNATQAGTGGAIGALAPQVALVVSLKTGRSGQANRGRVYIPGWHIDSDTGMGKCTQVAADDAVEFVQAIQDALEGRSLSQTIAHPARQAYDSPKPPFTHHDARPASAGPLVTGIVCLNTTWDTQRLRSV